MIALVLWSLATVAPIENWGAEHLPRSPEDPNKCIAEYTKIYKDALRAGYELFHDKGKNSQSTTPFFNIYWAGFDDAMNVCNTLKALDP